MKANLAHWLGRAIRGVESWQDSFGSCRPYLSLEVDEKEFGEALVRLADRLCDNYPFFHPCYAGQMVKPPHPAAVVGYVAAMLINPNNHALDGGPATAAMEREVVAQLAAMFGYEQYLGHLTTSGTIANLEALYVARESHPGKAIAYGADSHYTHARMCQVLGVEAHRVPSDGHGRMDLDVLEAVLRSHRIGTVVATAGTTGLGAVDPIHEIVPLARRYGARVHVDAAYGGFFSILAGEHGIPLLPWRAIADCDSAVVDPHKHGLQPYGCGSVLFRDVSVGRFFLHDSPYTYFTSGELHFGEISLECSRAGAAAAALWLTFELLPPTRDGIGRILAAGRRAAQQWAALLADSAVLELYQQPELDIVTYSPNEPSLGDIDTASFQIMNEGMHAPHDPIFLSTLHVTAEEFRHRSSTPRTDAARTRILRSVLMKPEHEQYVGTLHTRVEELARAAVLHANRQRSPLSPDHPYRRARW